MTAVPSARDVYPYAKAINVHTQRAQHEQMCDEIDLLRRLLTAVAARDVNPWDPTERDITDCPVRP